MGGQYHRGRGRRIRFVLVACRPRSKPWIPRAGRLDEHKGDLIP